MCVCLAVCFCNTWTLRLQLLEIAVVNTCKTRRESRILSSTCFCRYEILLPFLLIRRVYLSNYDAINFILNLARRAVVRVFIFSAFDRFYELYNYRVYGRDGFELSLGGNSENKCSKYNMWLIKCQSWKLQCIKNNYTVWER